jgi:hypothetical protein
MAGPPGAGPDPISENRMQKQQLVDLMLGLLQTALDEQNVETEGGEPVKATETLPLVGDNAAVTSMGLVSFIADVESTLADTHDVSVTLVSEQALSRKRSPFRSVDALADYILELVGAPVGQEVEAI